MIYDPEAIADLIEQVQDEGRPQILFDLNEGMKVIGELPSSWKLVWMADTSPRDVVSILWHELVPLLPNTIKMIERKIVGFAVLLTDTAKPSLLYLFDEGRDLIALRGHWPATILPETAAVLSVDLWPMYRLHDGWVNLFGGEGGPLPSGHWVVRGQANGVNGFLEVYSNANQALGFDLDEKPAPAFVIDTEDDEVEPIKNFWVELDERLSLSLRSFPDKK